MTDNKKDAFDMMFELIDQNPDITTDEIAKILVENGYAKSIESVGRFFVAIGIEES